ncbi:flocculation protein FLO11-like [Rhincodon typus]|uniref:flocculation protein FLO11-like n=1 Tax=Rhincodon typus TaxID=259920 RepID=UPI002030FEFB|nr:flocculation protein FLO11-like [Rhincodon typus]
MLSPRAFLLLWNFANLLLLALSQNGITALPVLKSPESVSVTADSAQTPSHAQMIYPLMASSSSDSLIPPVSASSLRSFVQTEQDVYISKKVISSTAGEFMPLQQLSKSTAIPQIFTQSSSSGSIAATSSIIQPSQSATLSRSSTIFESSTPSRSSTIFESSTPSSPSTIFESSTPSSPSTIFESSTQSSAPTVFESSTQSSPSTVSKSSTSHRPVFDSSQTSAASSTTLLSVPPSAQSGGFNPYIVIIVILILAVIFIVFIIICLARKKRRNSQTFVPQPGKKKGKLDDNWAGTVTLPEDGELNEATEDKKDEDLSSKHLSLTTFKRKSEVPTSLLFRGLDVEKGPDAEPDVREPLLSNGLSSGSPAPQDAGAPGLPSSPAPLELNGTVSESRSENDMAPVDEVAPLAPLPDTSQGVVPESEAPKTAF